MPTKNSTTSLKLVSTTLLLQILSLPEGLLPLLSRNNIKPHNEQISKSNDYNMFEVKINLFIKWFILKRVIAYLLKLNKTSLIQW